MKIISLVPSLTELLFDLGIENELVGITKFCIYPKKWHKTKNCIGGTKNLNINKIRELKPDLIIANKEENEKSQIEVLQLEFDVLISEISNIVETCFWIKKIGEKVNKIEKSLDIINKINNNFKNFKPSKIKNVVYLIWNNPIMSIGNDTFINHILKVNNWNNLFNNQLRYPVCNLEDIIKLNPDLLLLSSEPFPFKDKDVKYFQEYLPNTKIIIVDGEAFSWYGSRIIKTPKYLEELNLSVENITIT